MTTSCSTTESSRIWTCSAAQEQQSVTPEAQAVRGVALHTLRQKDKRAGFTLTELLAVMAIVALVVGTVSVSMEAILPGERLNTSIRELAADLQMVRTEAISRSMNYRLIYDLDEDRYRIATPFQVGGGRILTVDNPDDDEQRFFTPWSYTKDGVGIDFIIIGGEEYTEGQVFVEFTALGAATDHSVVLTQPAFENAFTIEVLGLTGVIKMHDGVFIREPVADGDFN